MQSLNNVTDAPPTITERITSLMNDAPSSSSSSNSSFSLFDTIPPTPITPQLNVVSASSSLNAGTESTVADSSSGSWIIGLLLFILFGFGIMMYLAKDPKKLIQTWIENVMSFFRGLSGEFVDNSAEGAKTVVSTTASTLDQGLSAVQPSSSSTSSKNKGQDVNKVFPEGDYAQTNTVNKALNSSSPQSRQREDGDYEADDANSSIQKGVPKGGWCYIGDDRGYRACAEVGANDMCMSGDIFPSHEICVNPKLRA